MCVDVLEDDGPQVTGKAKAGKAENQERPRTGKGRDQAWSAFLLDKSSRCEGNSRSFAALRMTSFL
jgi:hypothetical protein